MDWMQQNNSLIKLYLATFTNSQNKTIAKKVLTLLPKITSLRIKLVQGKNSKRFLDCKLS